MGFPNAYQYNTAQYLWATDQVSGSVNGYVSKSFTASFSDEVGEYITVYVISSGSGAPLSVKFIDMTVGVPLATMVIPVAGSASVNMMGPGITGTAVANQIGYFNLVSPKCAGIYADPSGTAPFRVVVTGR